MLGLFSDSKGGNQLGNGCNPLTWSPLSIAGQGFVMEEKLEEPLVTVALLNCA